MSGKLRVLAALRSQGARGITRVDFQAPTIDGGKPILNIPGRIYDLRHKDGHEIVEEGKRNACTVYRLLRDAQDDPHTAAVRAHTNALEDVSAALRQQTELAARMLDDKPRSAIFGWDEDAA